MAKSFRRHIRIDGKLVSSPRFSHKSDAEAWLLKMMRDKSRKKSGLDQDIKQILFLDFVKKWLKQRMKDYPKSTWSSDEQRFRKYVGPEFSGRLLHTISTREIISLLKTIKKEHKISDSTVNKVRVLISSIYSSAIEDGYAATNPTIGIKLKSRRKSGHKITTLESVDQVTAYLKAARRVSVLKDSIYPYAEAFAYLAFFTGMRKQELVAIRWENSKPEENLLIVKWKYLQADKKIVLGTKKGEGTQRTIFHDKALTKALKKWRDVSQYSRPSDFILTGKKGEHLSPYQITRLHNAILDEADIFPRITVHQIRHTFGRHYIKSKGNQKALQSLLGHSNSSTTDIYSDLNAEHLRNMDHSGVYTDED